ncbi:MAG: UDP-glucose dehydrogenase family protein [Thermoplasmatota archaeon]
MRGPLRITIAGAGYVGVVTGLVFARHGHHVTFVDLDASRLEALSAGRVPIHEPGLPDLLTEVRANIAVSSNLKDSVSASDFTFLCVGTPSSADGTMDLGQVRAAATEVGRGVKAGHVVVVKSTVIPGTTEGVVIPALEAGGRKAGRDFEVACNPEFLREGAAVRDALAPDRIVVGGSPKAANAVLALYSWTDSPKLVVAPGTAEMIKFAANTFLATRVALSNEIANLCTRTGVDWVDVARGIGFDARIGPQFLRAGVGFGGYCFPKDVMALAALGRSLSAPSLIAEAVVGNNQVQYREALRLLGEEVGEVKGKRVALLGLAFKADTDDVRETRAYPLWRDLTAAGAHVVCHDPIAGPAFLRVAPGARVVKSVGEALAGADAALFQTEWEEYKALEPARFVREMARPIVIDGRRTFDSSALRRAGVRYRAIGLG